MADIGSVKDYINLTEYKNKFPHTNFPANADDEKQYETMTDIDSEMLSQYQRYTQAFNRNPEDAYRIAAEEIGNTHKKLSSAMFNAEKYNWLRDSTLATQKFIMQGLDLMIKNIYQKALNVTNDEDTSDNEISAYSVEKTNDLLFGSFKAFLPASEWKEDTLTKMFYQKVECRGTSADRDYVRYPMYNTMYDAEKKSTSTKGFEKVTFSKDQTKAYSKAYGVLTEGEVAENNTATFWAFKKPTIDFCVMLKRV